MDIEPRHLAIARRARLALLESAPGESAAASSIARRCHPPPGARPVALLASLTSPAIAVIPLWVGLNRVAQGPPWSDYDPLPRKLLEGRQWLVFVDPPHAWACDDHSTNQSTHLAPDLLPFEDDPRHGDVPVPQRLALNVPGAQHLDWYGSELARLRRGSVLSTIYSVWVFDWLPAAAFRSRSEEPA
jgi:hypothetical protein